MKQNTANSILSVAKIFGLLIQAFVDKKKLFFLILVYPCMFCFLLSIKNKLH
jgi:hypothetical protein